MTFLLPILESCDWANGWSCDTQPVRKIIIKCLVVKILKIDFKENLPQDKKFLVLRYSSMYMLFNVLH